MHLLPTACFLILFSPKEGSIDPVMRALAAGGLLVSRIVPTYSGPPRRYYRITDQGRVVLAEWLGAWRTTRDFVNQFTEPRSMPS